MQADMFRMRGVPPTMLEILNNMHIGSPDRWIPRRLVLTNWWLFTDSEELLFGRGNLMLTGRNESGKTTVLVSIITTVLDRITDPYRIDTTGEATRTIRYYLVGKDEAREGDAFYYEDRTGYVALEFERGDSGQYVTVGIGLRTNRNWKDRRVESWSFVEQGNRRVVLDFDLMKDNGVPLSKHELQELLEPDGQVFDRSRRNEYQAAVNDALFGFRTLEDFLRYMEILHVVRRPKLGEGLSPGRVSEMLVSSLPSIDMAPIERASESFTRMDTIEAEIRSINEQLNAAEELEGAQIESLEARARADARAFAEARKELKSARDRRDRILADIERAERDVQEATASLQTAQKERDALVGELEPAEEEYRDHEAFDIQDSLDKARAEVERLNREKEELENDRRALREQADAIERQLTAQESAWAEDVEAFREASADLAAAARTAFWPQLAQRAELAASDSHRWRLDEDGVLGGSLVVSTIPEESHERLAALGPVLRAHEAVARQSEKYEEVRRAADRAYADYKSADAAHGEVLASVDEAREAALGAIRSWRAALAHLLVPYEELQPVLERIARHDDAAKSVTDAFAPLEPTYRKQRDARHQERLELTRQLREQQDERTRIEGEIAALESEAGTLIERSEPRSQARERLEADGVPCLPLFEACDFREGVLDGDAASAVEEALLDAGLLDALIVPRDQVDRVSRLLDEDGLADQWVRPHPHGEPNKWLTPAEDLAGVGAEDVSAVLESIGCGLDAALPLAVSRDGAWRVASLEGRIARPTGTVRYIGATNRRLERERRLADAKERLARCLADLDQLSADVDEKVAQFQAFENEWAARTALSETQTLERALIRLEDRAADRDRRRDAASAADEVVQSANERLQREKAVLQRATSAAPYARDRSFEALRLAEQSLQDLDRMSADLSRTLRRLGRDRERSAAARAQRQDVLARVEQFAPRIADKQSQFRTLTSTVHSLKERLAAETVGLDELKQRIDGMKTRLSQIDADVRQLERKLDRGNQKLEDLAPQRDRYEDAVRRAEVHAIEEERRLSGRLRSYPAFEGLVADGKSQGWDAIAYQLLGDASPDTDLILLATTKQNELTDLYYQKKETFSGIGTRFDPETGLIRFSTQEGELLVDEMLKQLENEVAVKSSARDQQDREIIQSVFLRDLTEAVREAIQQTSTWIHEVSDILEHMEMFRGRVLRLNWKVRSKTDRDPYDPKRLDLLFKQRGIALEESHQAELVDIFRNMIDEIRRRSEENNEAVDYRSALLDMLDYKRWYDLTIERRDGEKGPFLPLTRKRHGEGSVGRRTLDLLLPLIAAVYARLVAAAPSAPRLIGFDEAFAGLDDTNAAEIYTLLAKLQMSWIMATEKATNYGPHLPGAVTYEFINDGQDVAPTASVWDGRVRHTFEQEELEIERRFLGEQVETA